MTTSNMIYGRPRDDAGRRHRPCRVGKKVETQGMRDRGIASSVGRAMTGMLPNSSLRKLRKMGDDARDGGRWAVAAKSYRDYLRTKTTDFGIWVQLGNCLKEAGDYESAAAAYESAIALNDQNADAFLQKGHLMKLMRRAPQSVEAFRRSLEIKPENNPALQELLGLGVTDGLKDIVKEVERPTDKPIIYIDVTDLLDYLRVNLSLSGIQRVVANLLEYSRDFAEREDGCPVIPVFPDYDSLDIYTIKMVFLKSLIDLAAVRSGRDVINRALDLVVGSRSRVVLTKNDTLLIPGAFWIYQRYDLLNLLRQDGVRVTIFIHDLIQITNPEFVEPAATAVFRRSFADAVYLASYLLTSSVFVAEDIKKYLKTRMNFTVPVIPIALATELGSSQIKTNVIGNDIRDIITESFVLCVSTIEIRKNHLYIIQIWEELIKNGVDWIPNLVFVGKWGWEIQKLQKHLNSSDYLGGRLFILNGISDADLAILYQHCEFTLYSSYAEGWGLPVGESLGYGKPCVASNATSIPEVGGEFCQYFDPFDWTDGYRVVARILSDRPALVEWTARIQRDFHPKTWKAFAIEVFGTVAAHGRNEAFSQPGNNCLVENGTMVTFGNDSIAQLDARQQKLVNGRMTLLKGWHAIEQWGCWAAKRRASIAFKTDLPPETEVLMYFFLRTPEFDILADCLIKVGSVSTAIDDLGPMPRWFTARGDVSADGQVKIMIISGKGFQHPHGREFYVGILGLAICGFHDLKAREKVLNILVPGAL